MWLEGAVQNRWSVSHMRHQRWETIGALEDEKPSDDDVIASELDEDFEPAGNDPPRRGRCRIICVELGPREEGPDFGDNDDRPSQRTERGASVYADDQPEASVEFVRPFAELRELPDDLSEAFEAYKLAILHHKMDGWQQIAREDVLASLEALKQLVLAPSSENAPF